MRRGDVRLFTRILILNVVLLVVGIGSFTLFHLQRERQHLFDVSRQHAEVLLSTVERTISNAMCTGNTEEVQVVLELVGNSPHLLKVRIFHPDGSVRRSSLVGEVGQAVDGGDMGLFHAGERDGIFSVGDKEWLSVQSVIRSGPACIGCHDAADEVLGILNLHVSLDETREQLRATTALFAGSTLLMVGALALGLGWVLMHFVQRPIRGLAAQMARVEQGDLSARIAPLHNDELGRLAQSFNAMVERLEQARTQLRNFHFQQMERADRLASVGEMASGVAHEIKNPLAGISAAISVLSEAFEGDEEREAIVAEVLAQIARLNKTATDLLYFGRPAPPEFTHADLNELIDRTLFFASQHPEARNVEVRKALADHLPPVWVDEKQIQQVLFNIFINAMQAMEQGGIIEVASMLEARGAEHWVRVRIGDNGPGIAPEALEQIFTPFFTTKSQGTGLGLAICRQLLDEHQGRLCVENQVGQGAIFTLELPTEPVGRNAEGGADRGKTQDPGGR
ncbi:sensor histidine kinase [Geoalkalibacter halelectricus]|uniref:histidine kinase n=1 Tax=Geoalkalibacter halelectricus TaxID=2847045 RepID=A0ABY5ZS48_9BACT|nr:HAMP domain-containing sensor histidine kinase [Geoalkalibacter halelectricus]MDO3377474.1 ATP-binding protein [Geoalkalibacter halelectricus]UWZ80767.1 ATP-binding protein [Geoalkalibacter halelectricus]